MQYAGERAREFAHPILLVTADTELNSGPDAPAPHALATFQNIDLSEPIAYELRNLLPGRYYVVAIIADRDDFQPTTSPIGGYPSACTIGQMAEERSVRMEDDALDDIDITVFDALSDDPCFAAMAAPDSGSEDDAGDVGMGELGVLEAHVTAPMLSPAPGDSLLVNLFTESPLTNPTPAFSKTLDDPTFPATVSLDVPADDYTVIVCFKAADSPSDQCLGPNDRLAFYPSLSETVHVDVSASTVIDVELAP